MKKFFYKFSLNSLSVIFLSLIICQVVFAQTNNAETIFAEAEKLLESNSAQSQRQALNKFQSAAKLYKESKNQSGEANAWLKAGFVSHNLGEENSAIDFYISALKIFRLIEDKYGEADTLNNIGVVLATLGNMTEAFKFYERSLYILVKQVNDVHQASGLITVVYNNIGRVYEETGKIKEALSYYESALEHLEFIKDEGGIALTLNNIGSAYKKSGDLQKSLEIYEKALSLHRTANNKIGESVTLNNLGTIYFDLKNKPKVIGNLNQSLQITKLTGDKNTEALTLANLMSIWKNDNLQIAIFYGKQSVNRYQELRQSIKNLNGTTQQTYLKKIADTYRVLADLLIANGQFAEAEKVLQMLKEEEFSEFTKRDADEIKKLNQKVGLTEKERDVIKRYEILADRIAEIGQEFLKLDDKKRLLSRTNQNLSAEEQTKYSQLSAQIADANAAFRLFLEKDLSKELGIETTKKIEVDRNLQDKLRKWGNGTVALYTVITDDRYRVILTTPNIQIDGKTEIKSAELNKKVFAFREVLQNKKIDPRPLGKEIYDILLKPIEKELKASNAKTLVWSLDGVLRYIPLAAISPNGVNYLVENYQNVILTPKTRDDISNSNTDWRALGMGVSEEQTVSYPESPNEEVIFSALPDTKNELLAIVREENNPNEKGVLSGKRFLDADFTLANLSNSLAKETVDGKKKFTIVHFASHFRLGNNWSESFLLLGNSKILTLEELSNSPELDFGEVELVTLSACKTGLNAQSSGKEVESLADAIQTKGGKAVLATLWDVVDESTSLLMSNFYRVKKENPNLTKAEALQTAQKDLINGNIRNGKPRFAHPYYWSPFVIFGNWR
ncbi:MAG: CHAT domain-containing protein [Pyrinomonadaceae bacterium]|jgi:CHAT domain-containing protein/tetratricopeptide (TPR) repeat protein|nr:CHAT domain-containing protein [Pyrinomonadaceae bacterium]